MSHRFKPGHIGKALWQFARRTTSNTSTVRRVRKVDSQMPTIWRKATTRPLIWPDATDSAPPRPPRRPLQRAFFDDGMVDDGMVDGDMFDDASVFDPFTVPDVDTDDPVVSPVPESVDLPPRPAFDPDDDSKTPPDLLAILEAHRNREAQEAAAESADEPPPPPKVRPQTTPSAQRTAQAESPAQDRPTPRRPRQRRRPSVQEIAHRKSDTEASSVDDVPAIPDGEPEDDLTFVDHYAPTIDADDPLSEPARTAQSDDITQQWAAPSRPVDHSQSKPPERSTIARKPQPEPIQEPMSDAVDDFPDELELLNYDEADYITQPISSIMPETPANEPPPSINPAPATDDLNDLRRAFDPDELDAPSFVEEPAAEDSESNYPLNIWGDDALDLTQPDIVPASPSQPDVQRSAQPDDDSEPLLYFNDEDYQPTEPMQTRPEPILPRRRASIVELPGFHVPIDEDNTQMDDEAASPPVEEPRSASVPPPSPASAERPLRKASPPRIQREASPPPSHTSDASEYDDSESNDRLPTPPQANQHAIQSDDTRGSLLSLLDLPEDTSVAGWDEMVNDDQPMTTADSQPMMNDVPLDQAFSQQQPPQVQRAPAAPPPVMSSQQSAPTASDDENTDAEALDLDKLSQDVFRELRHRFRIERERRGKRHD